MAFKPNFQPPPKKPIATDLGIQQLISKFCHENDFAKSPENTKVFRDSIDTEHDGVWYVENLRSVVKHHRTELTRAVTIKTLPRMVSVEEMQSMLERILSANPWIADTDKNGELIAATFLDDPRMSPKRNLQDMINAVEIVKAQLDVNKPAPPPKPQYDEGPLKLLSDGSMPLPLDTPEWTMRSASVSSEQMRDLTARLRKYEVWGGQNEQ